MAPTDGFVPFVATTLPTAVAFIISSNLSNVLNTLQTGCINPALGLVIGSDLSQLSFTARAETDEDPAIQIQYGQVLSSLLSFIIVAFVVYIVVRLVFRYTKIDATKKL